MNSSPILSLGFITAFSRSFTQIQSNQLTVKNPRFLEKQRQAHNFNLKTSIDINTVLMFVLFTIVILFYFGVTPLASI